MKTEFQNLKIGDEFIQIDRLGQTSTWIKIRKVYGGNAKMISGRYNSFAIHSNDRCTFPVGALMELSKKSIVEVMK